jgi:hypothetical protein
MSRGPDNIITDLLKALNVPNPSLLAEEVIEALEAEEYVIVHKDQVRSRDELVSALRAKKGQ